MLQSKNIKTVMALSTSERARGCICDIESHFGNESIYADMKADLAQLYGCHSFIFKQ